MPEQITETVPAAPDPAVSIGAELRAMEAAFLALCALDRPARERALCWLNSRLRWDLAEDDEVFPF